MTYPPISRRGFMSTGLASGVVIAGAATAQAQVRAGEDGFEYELTRTEAEWKAMLSDADYKILRRGSTELPKASPLWNETRNGTYACKGCELHTYDANWKVTLDKGWAFFRHSTPNSVLTNVDGPVLAYGSAMNNDAPGAMIEAHCRRCGSHLGHIVIADGMLL
ncbi:MAG: peptide-methionine (R)-S-oxide reductase, partial [Paracoccaceae bacterium]